MSIRLWGRTSRKWSEIDRVNYYSVGAEEPRSIPNPLFRQESEVETFQWFSEDELELQLHENPEMFLKGVEEYFAIFSKRIRKE